MTVRTLESLRAVEPDLDVYVVDDCSPELELAQQVGARATALDMSFVRKEENEGFSHTVNHGLRRATITGQDVVLLNADMEFNFPFVDTLAATDDSKGRPAAVVGALLFYPSGMIQHAGVYFSFFTRSFDHRYRYAPAGLPEAYQPTICPVTGALQFIRASTIEEVGLYDEDFRMGFEDVDYCLRVFDAGLECVYNPAVRAIHHESLFRGSATERLDEWHDASLRHLHKKHGKTSLGQFVPPIA